MALVALSPGQIAFGGYIFPRSFLLQTASWQNETETTSMPFAPGSFSTAKPGSRTFTVTGSLGGIGAVLDQNGNPMLTADQVQAEVDRLMALLASDVQPLQYRVDRYVFARMQQPRITYSTGSGYRVAELAIDFLADDPRSYGVTTKTVATSATNTSAPTVVGTPNAGNTLAYPTLTLTFAGATSGVGINVFVGSHTTQIGFPGPFAAGDTVVLNCDPRSRSLTRNGVKAWTNIALPTFNDNPAVTFLPAIPPSGAPWTLGLFCTAGGNCALSAAFADTWL